MCFKKARVETMPLDIRIQWNAGTVCMSECVLKTLACRGLRVGPSKLKGLNAQSRLFHRERNGLPSAVVTRHPLGLGKVSPDATRLGIPPAP